MFLWPMPPLWICVLIYIGLSNAQSASMVNFTVDDTSSQIIYYPQDSWRIGQECQECEFKPEAQLAFQGTWHYGLTNGSGTLGNRPLFANFSFSGSAIYVFGIVPSADLHDFTTSLSFWIDDESVGEFHYTSVGSNSEYQYGVPLYSNTSMEDGSHIFSLYNGGSSDQSLVMLDSVIYSRPISSTSSISGSASGSPVGAIAGGILGGLAFLLIGVLGALWYRRKHDQPFIPQVGIHPGRWFGPTDSGNVSRFDPGMMVSARETPPIVNPSREQDNLPVLPLTSSQRRILAWQRQTAVATGVNPRTSDILPAPSDALSSYWDNSTESYKDWEARQTSRPAVHDVQTRPGDTNDLLPNDPSLSSLHAISGPSGSSHPAPHPIPPLHSPLPPLPPLPQENPQLSPAVPENQHTPSSFTQSNISPGDRPSSPIGIRRENTLPPPTPLPRSLSVPPPARRPPRRTTRRLTVMNN